MMKIVYGLSSILTLLILIAIVFSTVSCSRKPRLGLNQNQLLPCPSSPNCICSEYPDQSGYAAPLTITGHPNEAWQRAGETITTMGGRIVEDNKHYLHAVFTSRIFRFIDDLELRLDDTAGVLHVRSASRTGYSDMGVNKKRIEALRALFVKQ
jgi:flagellin-like protein